LNDVSGPLVLSFARHDGSSAGSIAKPRGSAEKSNLMPFEVLNRALVLLGSRARPEGAQVATLAGFRVSFPRIEAIPA